MSLVITPSGGGGVTFTEPTDGCCGSAGKYRLKNPLTNAKYRRDEVKPPAVAGAAVVRHNFDERPLDNFEVIYVAAGYDACLAAYAGDHDSIINKSCSVAVGGQTFPACEVEKFDTTKGPKYTSQNGMYRLHCVLGFKQERLS